MRVLIWLGPVVLLAALWGYGFSRFVVDKRVLVQQVHQFEEHPSARHNVAAWRFGPTISASSFLNDFDEQQHPLFVVDQVKNPTFLERWTSNPRDRRPWIEVRWSSPMNLDKVVLWHASLFDPDNKAARKFSIRCLATNSESYQTVEIADNMKSVSSHELHCPGAAGVRVELTPLDGRSSVHLYELEVWGQ